MKILLCSLGFLVNATVVLSSAVQAQETREYRELDALGFTLENDSSIGSRRTDRWFTNAFRADWSYKPGQQNPAFEALSFVPKLLVTIGASENSTTRLGGSFGQLMYTPSNLERTSNQVFDRPYAGWLYVGGIAQSQSSRAVRTSEFRLGPVGPASLAGDVQRVWHKTINAQPPNGWSNQLRPYLGAQLGYTHHQAVPTFSNHAALTPYASAQAGNIRTYGSVGVVIAVGRNVDSTLGPPGGEGDAQILTGLSNRLPSKTKSRGQWQFVGFAEYEARYYLSNQMVTATRFGGGGSEISLTRNVQQWSVGITGNVPLSKEILQTTLAYYTRTPEFSTGNTSINGKNQSFVGLNVTFDY
jgi:hypothetical protein